LYLAAWHLGSLLFDLINRAFPDPADSTYMLRQMGSSVRWSIASILASFPVFLFVARHLRRELAANPVKRLSAVRRWLTYLTLFIAVSVLVGDVITLIYTMLGGEFTVRFGLKVLVAAVIAGATFGYYLNDLHRDEKEEPSVGPSSSPWGRWLAIAASVAMVVTIAVAIQVTGTPSELRRITLDDRRVGDLSGLEAAVEEHYKQHTRLPSGLTELASKPGNTLVLVDPETNVPYVYVPIVGRQYQLCAVFTTDSSKTGADTATRWQHGAGKQCFDRHAQVAEE
jgi:hypothetical protein